MERSLILLFSLVSLVYVIASPVREKISFNREMLEKVREQSNDTTRDKTARNINFAWRVSFTRTSTTTARAQDKTTLAIKDIENNQAEYQKIFTQMTITLKDPHYRRMWTDLVKNKGYATFLAEVKNGGHKMFMKDNKDGCFDGPDGTKFWDKIIGFLETMGEKGFDLLLNSVDNTPLASTPIPAGPKETVAPPPQPSEPPKEEKPTEVPK